MKTRATVTVDIDVLKAVQAKCIKNGAKLSSVINVLLKDWITKN